MTTTYTIAQVDQDTIARLYVVGFEASNQRSNQRLELQRVEESRSVLSVDEYWLLPVIVDWAPKGEGQQVGVETGTMVVAVVVDLVQLIVGGGEVEGIAQSGRLPETTHRGEIYWLICSQRTEGMIDGIWRVEEEWKPKMEQEMGWRERGREGGRRRRETGGERVTMRKTGEGDREGRRGSIQSRPVSVARVESSPVESSPM